MPSPRVVKVPCLHHLNMIMEHGLYIGGIGFGLISRFRWSQGAPNRPSLPLLEGTIPADARLAVTCHRCDGTMHGIGHGIISMYATAWKNHLKKSQPSSMIFNSDLELQEKTFQWLWWLVTSSGYIKLDDRTHVTATKNLSKYINTLYKLPDCAGLPAIFCSQEDWKGCWSGQKMFFPVQAHPILHFSFKVVGFALVKLKKNHHGRSIWPKTPMIMSRKQAKANKVKN